MLGKIITKYKNSLLLFTGLFLSTVALAGDYFTPSESDKAMMLLAGLFGKVGLFGGGNSDAFAAVMGGFNSACLVIGGILVGYTLLAGTLGTAHDGEMLGKKFSSVWVPIRTTLGTALVLPIKAGYCTLQLIVAWLVVQSIGLASSTWVTFLKADNLANSIVVSIPNSSVRDFTYGALEVATCAAALKATIQQNPLLYPRADIGVTTDKGMWATVYKFGDKNETNNLTKSSCGEIKVYTNEVVSGVDANAVGAGGMAATAVGTGLVGTFGTAGAAGATALGGSLAVPYLVDKIKLNQMRAELQAGQAAAFQTLLTTAQAQGEAIVASNAPIDPKIIEKAISVYEADMKKKATAIVADTKPFANIQESAEKDGFLLAGAYYTKLSYMNDTINSVMAEVPQVTRPSDTITNTVLNGDIQKYFKALQTTLQKGANQNSFGINTVGKKQVTVEPENSDAAWYERWWKAVKENWDPREWLKKGMEPLFNFVISPNENPIITLKNIGNTLLTVGSVSMLTVGTSMISIGNLPGVGLFLQSVLTIICGPIMLLGVVLSFIIPNMPFFMWLGAVLGWVLLVVEAMIAAPIWAVMHLHPSGDDMTGKGGNGYTLILSLLLRPVFLIFGFIASIVIMQLFGQIYNSVFMQVFSMNTLDQANVIIVILGYVGAALVYAGGLFIIIKQTFGIITDVPDNLLNWISSSSGQLGKHAEGMGGMSSGAFAAINEGGRMMDKASGGMAQKGIENIKENREQNKQDAATKEEVSDKFGDKTSQNLHKDAKSAGGGKLSTGFGSLAGQQVKSDFDAQVKKLGGADTDAGQAFVEAYNNLSENNPEMTFGQKMVEANRIATDNEFGEGATSMFHGLQNNEQGGSPEQLSDFDAVGYNDARNSVQRFKKGLGEAGLDANQRSEVLSSLISEVNNQYDTSPNSRKNGGGMSYRDTFSSVRKRLEKEHGVIYNK